MTNWTISLPDDVTIIGIYFNVTASTTGCEGGDNGLALTKASGATFFTTASDTYTSVSIFSHVYPNGTNDPLWNTTWTPEDLNNVQC